MPRTLFAITSLSFALAAAPALAHEAPRIFAGSNGEIEATFSSNSCVVYYDARGQRKSANENCSRTQIERAKSGVASYRREQGMDGYAGSEAPPGGFGRPETHHGPPEVVMDNHGRGHVLVGGQCIVYYGRDGKQSDTNSHCNSSDRRMADTAMESYRREQGLSEKHSSGYTWGIPVLRLRNGNYQATVSGTCTVYVNDRGGLMTSLPDCTIAEKANAAIAVLQYRRNN